MSLSISDLEGGSVASCWNTIGIGGDRSCPELVAAIHCRNCPVFESAARTFFDRPAPDDYLAEWTRELESNASCSEAAGVESTRNGVGILIFRLGAEWLALPASVVVEVTSVRPSHRIPHRSGPVLAGLVNLRGQLYLCASLHGLLDVAPEADGAASGGVPRMIVIRQGAESWVFTAEEVLGVPRVSPNRLRPVPSTLANPSVSFSEAVFTWEGRSVGLLDEGRLFESLRSHCE
jgi:chemotaxis-related protein WspD